jgi:DNA mismatch repair protein MutL
MVLRLGERRTSSLPGHLNQKIFNMAITPLPQATVHLLGSAQALTTPISLVKELIDNALDARATSIDILISSNTIDKIEVRDNGYGIQQEDLNALGRRGHTSKLRSFDELKSIGGISLGFRGEALASAVQLGEVAVTTRTEGEVVATAVKLKAPGGIDNRSRTSHPIGTTVSVTKFMYKLPVRKQTFLKESSKTLGKIKELLQAYALARPSIKFSFKVLKENKASWSYAPRPNDGIREAVSQIIGKEAASQCVSKSTRFSERIHDGEIAAEEGMNLEASGNFLEPKSKDFILDVFLPRRDADPSKIGHGQFISVDSRPVSHEKNTMRKIVTIFKYYMRDSLAEALGKTKSPFLRLNITCPAGSYDPNVEPAKNDVIFGNESVVLEAIENLFKEVYGEPKALPAITPPQRLKEKLDNFELLLARKPTTLQANDSPSPPRSESMAVQAPEATNLKEPTVTSTINKITRSSGGLIVDSDESDEPLDSSKRKWVFDMSKDLSEDVEEFQRPTHQPQQSCETRIPDPETEPAPKNSLNPWIIAKLVAPVQQRVQLTNTAVSYSVSQPTADALSTPQHSSESNASDPEMQCQGRPSRPRQTFRDDDIRSLNVPSVQNLSYQHPRAGIIQQPESQTNRRASTGDADDEVLLDGDDSGIQTRRNDFVSARDVSDTALLSPPTTLGPKKPRGVNRPFLSPMRNMENDVSHDGLLQTKLVTNYGESRGHKRIHRELTEQPSSSDLDWSMDFEHRKEFATRRRRDELRAATLEVDSSDTGEVVRTSSPHKNRYNAAVATLEAGHASWSKIQAAKEPFKTSLPDGDPRAYLMRRQKSIIGQNAKLGEALKMTRPKSNRLPLENISEHEKTYNLTLGLAADMGNLRRITRQLMKSDMYVKKGNNALGLRIGGLETTGVASGVQAAVTKWMEREGEENCEVEYKFENLETTGLL